MGVYFKVNEIRQDLNMAYQLMKQQDDLVKELYEIVEAHKPYQREDRKDIQEKFSDLKQLLVYDSLERSKRLTLLGAQKRDQLLEKHGAQNAPEVIAGIAGEINEHYNRRDTAKAKWVDLKVQFLKYSAENYQELAGLKELENMAKRLRADNVAQKVNKVYQELVDEENEFWVMVKKLKPEKHNVDKYNVMTILIEQKINLYKKQGRTDLLRTYNQHVRNCGGDPVRIEEGIQTADKYWREREQKTLGSLTQSAQALRQEREEGKAVIKRTRERGL
ncbi:MAG: hypothetical protein PHX01_04495 [Clostridia bacterium]|nr:hypothetical protein [Clostridia bacterium]